MNLIESQAGNYLQSYKIFRVKEEKEAQRAKEEKEVIIEGRKENRIRKREAKGEAKRKKLL